MEFWMNNQSRKSVKLSDSRENERNQYFMRNHKELKTLMDKITNYGLRNRKSPSNLFTELFISLILYE